MDIPCKWTGKDSTGVVKVGCPMNSHRRPLDRWTGQDSGTSLISEGGMSCGCPLDRQDNPKWTEDFDSKLGHE